LFSSLSAYFRSFPPFFCFRNPDRPTISCRRGRAAAYLHKVEPLNFRCIARIAQVPHIVSLTLPVAPVAFGVSAQWRPTWLWHLGKLTGFSLACWSDTERRTAVLSPAILRILCAGGWWHGFLAAVQHISTEVEWILGVFTRYNECLGLPTVKSTAGLLMSAENGFNQRQIARKQDFLVEGFFLLPWVTLDVYHGNLDSSWWVCIFFWASPSWL